MQCSFVVWSTVCIFFCFCVTHEWFRLCWITYSNEKLLCWIYSILFCQVVAHSESVNIYNIWIQTISRNHMKKQNWLNSTYHFFFFQWHGIKACIYNRNSEVSWTWMHLFLAVYSFHFRVFHLAALFSLFLCGRYSFLSNQILVFTCCHVTRTCVQNQWWWPL